ncbi:MAG: hypothetical protein AAF488_17455, partial [Planctomycetota bacterium]
MRIDTIGSDFDTLLAVYQGESVDDLALVAANDDHDFLPQSRVVIRLQPGQSFRVAVDGYRAETGQVMLQWRVDEFEECPDPVPPARPTPR